MFLAYVGFRERKSLFAFITLFSNPPLLYSVWDRIFCYMQMYPYPMHVITTYNYACNTFSRDCYFSRESIKNDTFLYQTKRDSEMNSYLLSALIIGSLINQHLYYLFASFHIERDNFLKLVVFFLMINYL